MSYGRLFHANGLATVKLRGPKPSVFVRGKPGHSDLPKANEADEESGRTRIRCRVLQVVSD